MTEELTKQAAEITAEYETIWKATAQVLRSQVSEAVWFSTFNDAVPVFDDKMSLRLRVPNSFVRDRILTRYMSLVRDALDEVGAADRELLVDIQTATAVDVLERLTTDSPTTLDEPVVIERQTKKKSQYTELALVKVRRSDSTLATHLKLLLKVLQINFRLLQHYALLRPPDGHITRCLSTVQQVWVKHTYYTRLATTYTKIIQI